MKEIGIYIHIPFCKKKCFYCDFCSYENFANYYEEYIESVINEIRNFKLKENLLVKTVYIGGGTPSIIDAKFIEKIFTELKNKFYIDKNVEATIEVNPGTVNKEKLETYKLIGINRISIGLQSTNDNLLKLIGRIHDYEEFEDCYTLARNVGFSNINVDLMIGLPTQTLEDVKESLKNIINKDPEHISVYSLILEDDTKLKKLVDDKILEVPDDDTERAMYWMVKDILEKNGYYQYEISNFSKKTYESKHNTDCWKQKEYIGFGAAAHSYFNNLRYSNICDITKYINNIRYNEFEKNIEVQELQNKEDKMNEYMILSLRMIEGVSIDSFIEKFEENPKIKYQKEIEKLRNQNLISYNNKYIKLTKKGIDFANVVWSEFI